jgi:hypothetical protein
VQHVKSTNELAALGPQDIEVLRQLGEDTRCELGALGARGIEVLRRLREDTVRIPLAVRAFIRSVELGSLGGAGESQRPARAPGLLLENSQLWDV